MGQLDWAAKPIWNAAPGLWDQLLSVFLWEKDSGYVVMKFSSKNAAQSFKNLWYMHRGETEAYANARVYWY